jgi:hypothetical protein
MAPDENTPQATPDTAAAAGNADRARSVARQMADVADQWLNTLTDNQIRAGLYSAPLPRSAADLERRRWFYVPTDHGGLTLEQQGPAQQQLVMKLLASGLSREGYVAATSIIGLENILDLYEDFSLQWGFQRGRDSGRYYLRIFGDPREDDTWAWRFAGHHLSINFLVVGGAVASTTPFFLGADPARAPLPGGAHYSPLGGIERLAFRFAATLDGAQRGQMQLLDRAVADIVTGNRDRITDGDRMIVTHDLFRGPLHDSGLRKLADGIYVEGEEQSGFDVADHRRMAYTSKPKGLAAVDLDDGQRELLRELVSAAAIGVPSELNEPGRDPLAGMHIAWGGPLDSTPVYFRLQADDCLYEYDNTQRRGNHAHTVLRNPRNDFGVDVLRDHYANVTHG